MIVWLKVYNILNILLNKKYINLYWIFFFVRIDINEKYFYKYINLIYKNISSLIVWLFIL